MLLREVVAPVLMIDKQGNIIFWNNGACNTSMRNFITKTEDSQVRVIQIN